MSPNHSRIIPEPFVPYARARIRDQGSGIRIGSKTIHSPHRRDEKVCNRCLVSKPRSAFYKMSSAKDGLQSCCIECRKAYNAANREQINARHYDYLVRTGRITAPGSLGPRPLPSDAPKRAELKIYGLSLADYEWLTVTQGFRCAICFRDPNPSRRLAIDHDHETGTVRGLLCDRCNLALGIIEDDPERLRSAANYLESHAPSWMARSARSLRGVQCPS